MVAAPAGPAASPAAASAEDTLLTGRVIPRVSSSSDPGRSYALYLPSAYDPARRWPVLLIMDPRGRALMAMDLFRHAAERHGWIVLSSYDTRSDLPEDVAEDPNEAALRAMLGDVEAGLSFHPRRIYLAGFSGTARLAWVYAERLSGHVAGIIGFGGALFRTGPADGTELAFYGGAGRLGFNYQEMRRVDRLLDLSSPPVPHRLSFWDGPHGWAPRELCAEALAWMEARAMRRGLRDPDTSWVAEYYRGQLERGADLEAIGRPAEARDLYRRAARDAEGLVEAGEARRRAERLDGTDRVRERVALLDRLADEERELQERLYPLVDEIREEERVPDPEDLLERLEVGEVRARLVRHAAESEEGGAAGAGSDAVVEREGAARLLEIVYVQFSFYLPRWLLARGRPDEALRALEVAEGARPGRPRTCLFRARAHVAAGRHESALAAVRCAVEGGIDPAFVASDPDLAPLRGEPGWAELVDGRGDAPPP